MLDFIRSRDFLPPLLPLCVPVVPCFLSPADSGGMVEGQGEGEGWQCLTTETDDAAHHLCKQKSALGLMEHGDMTLPIEPLSLDSRCVLTVTRPIQIQLVNISTR